MCLLSVGIVNERIASKRGTIISHYLDMAITYHNNNCDFKFRDKRKVSAWIRRVIAGEGFTIGGISVVFCSDQALLEINRQFLGHDYFTDIITFDYSADGLLSGDLMISADTVADNAATLKITFEKELHRVIIHGILHLCGYGDKTDNDERLMRSLEDKYLALL